MRNLIKLSVGGILVASFTSGVTALELVPSLDLNEVMPRDFATVAVAPSQEVEKQELEINYATDAVAWTPVSLNKVMNAYGKSLSVENAEEIPSWFAQPHEEIGEDGQLTQSLKFGSSAYAWYATSLHKVMSAYGLKLPVDNLEQLPSGYAQVVEQVEDGKTVSKLKFGKDGNLWTGQGLAQVLLAYQ